MAINFNTGPYYDDFDPANNFYKVLFKPGYAVQARELNQLQSILQHQISSTANHIFKKNTVVIPGGIALNTAADIVGITGIKDPSVLVGQTITNGNPTSADDDSELDSSVTAVVLGYRDATDDYPVALYVKYIKTGNNGQFKFATSEDLRTVGPTLYTFKVHDNYGSTVGKVATLAKGTFYTKELFVDCATQSIVVETDSSTTTNCIIGLNVIESIVTAEDDDTLLDNSNGTPNQYAPGADRYKVELVLAKYDLGSSIDDDKFIRLMVVENNVITYLNNNTQYAEIMKMLARRTYDANGNFIVRGLDTAVIQSSDDDYLWMNVGAGKCYLGGYEYDQLTTQSLPVAKPRDEQYQQEMQPVVTYSSTMPYFYVAGGAYATKLPQEDTLVQLLNADPSTVGAQIVGYGIFKYIQFAQGSVESGTDVYKAFFDYVALEKGYTISDVGGIRVIGTGQGVPILHQLKVSNVIGTFTPGVAITSGTGGSETATVFSAAASYLYAIKNTLNAVPTGDTIVQGLTTALRTGTFVSNYSGTFVPMIQVDTDAIKTLYIDGQSSVSYSVVRRDSFAVTAAGTYEPSGTLGANDTYDNYSTTNYFAYNVDNGEFINLDGMISLSAGGKKYQLTVEVGSPLIGVQQLWVYSTYTRTKVTQATKTATQLDQSNSFVIPNPSRSWMSLGHQDVTAITKVVDGSTVTLNIATWNAGVITYTTTAATDLQVGDVVVVKGVTSANNTSGAYNAGYNGRFTVTSVISTTQFTVQPAGWTDPGSFVTTGTVALPPKINLDTDITSRFFFDTGSTINNHGVGMIKLKKNATPPAGQIAVMYTYYDTDASAGDFVSVDSYMDLNNPDDLSYIGEIDDLYDTDKSKKYSIRNYIDFRSTTSKYYFRNIGTIAAGTSRLVLKDLNLSGLQTDLVGKYIVGPGYTDSTSIASVEYNTSTGNTELVLSGTAVSQSQSGIYYIGLNGASLSIADTSAGAKKFSFPKDSTRITYQYIKFLPKRVLAYVNRVGDELKVDVMEVNSIAEALALRRNEYKLPLAYLYMKPYTVSIDDVTLTKFENPVYQMLDIHALKERIDRTEYYTSLALDNDIHQAIIDANNEGLNQAGRGFWNEDFMNPGAQDTSSDDFACTVYDKSYVGPGTVVRTVNLELDQTHATSTWKQTGTNVTLPYTEVRAISNESASRYNNLNPYNVTNWAGKMTLNPSVDNWVDTTIVPATTTVSTQVLPPATPPAPVATTVAPTVTTPPPVLPSPPVEEIIVEISNVRTKWGPDSRGGFHGITFNWRTNLGRTGRVNTDNHLAPGLTKYGNAGIDGTYARGLLNKKYNDPSVKAYLNSGTHFDQKPPSKW